MPHPASGLSFGVWSNFNFPRSYVKQVHLFASWDSVVVDGPGQFSLFYSPDPNYHGHLWLKSEFWTWNSNVYSLDWVFEGAWYTYGADPTEIAYPWAVSYEWDDAAKRTGILMTSPATTHHWKLSLPPADLGYWLAPEFGD
jgi:hypothetical protein